MKTGMSALCGSASLWVSVAAGALAAPMAQAQTQPSALATIEALTPKAGTAQRGVRLPVGVGRSSRPQAPARHRRRRVLPKLQAFAARPMVAAPTKPAPAADARDRNVAFASGSAVLSPAAMQSLETLGEALSSTQLQGLQFRIEGHTDTVGTTAANLALSQERAQAVADYLATKFSVARDRLQPVGNG